MISAFPVDGLVHGRGTRVAALISIAVLTVATHALAQARPIRGKVTDDQGRAVAGAAIEVTSISESIVGFVVQDQRRPGGRKWQAISSENGDYMVGVSTSGVYLVSASMEGVGFDETQIVVELGGVPNVNLRLRKAVSARVGGDECAGSTDVKTFGQGTAAANTRHPSLARLLRWLEAVRLHTPGCGDSPVLEVGKWSPSDLETLLGDLGNLSAFLRWVQEKPDERSTEARSSIKSLTGGVPRPSEARFVRDSDRAAILLYNRRFNLDEIEGIFHGNDTLRRGAVLHADIAVFVPGNFIQYPVVDDGRRKGGRRGTVHWQIGRQLLDTQGPGPGADGSTLLWYRAVSAYLFREGHLAEVAQHLDSARQVFPKHPMVLLDSAYLHLELSSPAIQAAVQEIRTEGSDVAVNSRRSELQSAERFLRELLAIAPDDAEARSRLGHTLGELGRHEEAAAELRRAIAANSNSKQLYLAELFLGRQEHALGRRAEAQRRYENAAEIFPDAQSPRLALSHLAGQAGDRAAALRALRNITAPVGADDRRNDPWLYYYRPHLEDAGPLMREMRGLGEGESEK